MIQKHNFGVSALKEPISSLPTLRPRLRWVAAVALFLLTVPAPMIARQQQAQPQSQSTQPQQGQQQPVQPTQPASKGQRQHPDSLRPPGAPSPVHPVLPPAAVAAQKKAAEKNAAEKKAAEKKATEKNAATKTSTAAPHKAGEKQSAAAPAKSNPDAKKQTAATTQTAAKKQAASGKTTAPKAAAPAMTPAQKAALQGKFGTGTGNYRSCLKGDETPNGTVTDGFKKTVTPTPMGNSCYWEKVE